MEPHGQVSSLLSHPLGADVTAWLIHSVITLLMSWVW